MAIPFNIYQAQLCIFSSNSTRESGPFIDGQKVDAP